MIKKIFFIPFILLLTAFVVFAQEEKNNPPPKQQNMQAMAALFKMSDDELEKLAVAIERIRKIPQEQRRQMAQEMQCCGHGKNRDEQKRMMKKMRSRFQNEERKILNQYFKTLDEESAEAEREAFVKMSPRERREFMKKIREKINVPEETVPDGENPPPPQHKPFPRGPCGEKDF